MSDHWRERTTPARLAVLIAATLLGGMIAAVAVVGSSAIEPRLMDAAREALRTDGITGIDVRFDGREAFLTGTGATESQLARAERVVEAVDGVRWATVVAVDPATRPALLVLEDAAGTVTVGGVVGTAEQASAIEQAAADGLGPGTSVQVTVREGVAVAAWTERLPAMFAALAQVDGVSFSLEADRATLTGAARDPAAVEEAVGGALVGIPFSVDLQRAGPTEAETAAINATVIRFPADSVTLDEVARQKVLGLADALRRFPEIGVTLTGHIAIAVGTADDAMAFSLQRARTVAEALAAAGIDPVRIEIEGAGDAQPVGDNATDAGAAANRRVTVLVEDH